MRVPPLAAVALGPVVAGIVWRAGLLTVGGACVAAAVGSASALAGFDWMTLLMTFFMSSVLLGHVGRATKQQRGADIIGKAGPRDAIQVLANGTLFGIGAVLSATGHLTDASAAAALGALAAATADTWGTELGMLAHRAPRSILTWAPVETGISGGVSVEGLCATVAGASLLSTVAWLLLWPAKTAGAGAIGGIVGAMADSVLGAALQQRRRSQRTGRMTERLTDVDGTPTVAAGGLAWLNNDGVNFAATAVGACAACAAQQFMAALGRP
jgi:uncharacterized protein (TIGR00297 family)